MNTDSSFSGKRILITGGAGFIGSHLAESFQGEAEVRILDNLRTGSRNHLDGMEIELMEGSILDDSLLRAAMRGVDTVYHLAAMVSVPESVSDPAGCHELNATGTLRVLQAAADAGVPRLFFAGSAAIYGNNPTVPKTEQMAPEPESPYAITKLLGEHWCRFFTRAGRLNAVALRFFNVFGPRQDPQGPYAAAVAGFIEKALRGEPLVIHGDGGQTRDFIYVKDIVAAMRHVMEHGNVTGIYNAEYGAAVSIRELAERIIALTGSASEIVYQADRPGDVRHSRAAVSALEKTGFKPPAGFETGLQTTVDFHRNRLHQR